MTSPNLVELRPKTVDFRALGEIRLVALEDGPGRGKRLLLCRNAAALECEISVDRGFDITALRWRGLNLGWNGPAGGGVPARELDAEDGLGLLRSFDGFLVTCGLDHYGLPAVGPAEDFIYPHRARTHHPLHGRISSVGATLRSYGLDTDGANPMIWCEAELRQAALFGEVLALRRRIEIPLFEPLLRIHDRVSNAGWRPTRHRMLYHFNLGYPLLDEQTVLTGDFAADLLTDFVSAPPIPASDVVERFDAGTALGDASGRAHAGVFNPALAGGTGLDIQYSAATLPGLGLWRAWQSGIYALGIEPNSGAGPGGGLEAGGRPESNSAPELCTRAEGNSARQRSDSHPLGSGLAHHLGAGESRDYRLVIRIAPTPGM